MKKRSNGGRNKIINERGNRILNQTVRKTANCESNCRSFQTTSSKTFSVRTIPMRLHSQGINRHKVRQTLTVSEVSRKRRIKWCKNMKNHEAEL